MFVPTVNDLGNDVSVVADCVTPEILPEFLIFHIAPPSYPTYFPKLPDGTNFSNLTAEYL